MMQALKNSYLKLGEEKFRWAAVISCLWGDIAISKYLYDKFTDKAAFDRNYDQSRIILDKVYAQQGIQLPEDFKHQVFQLMINSLMFSLSLFLLFHVFNYTFYIFKKRFAHIYLTFLTWVGVIGALGMAYSSMSSNPGWATLFMLQSILFFLVAFGLRIFPTLSKKATPVQAPN
jgi:hypothetical protein